MFERYTEKARRTIFFARYEASQFGSPSIETEHLLLGLLREDQKLAKRILLAHASIESIRKQIEGRIPVRKKVSTSVDMALSAEGQRVLAYAAEESENLSHKHIGTEHLLLGLLREDKCLAAEILRQWGLRLSTLRKEFARAPSQVSVSLPSMGFSLFAELIRDLTQAAAEGHLDPLIGRQAELERMIQILCRRSRNDPVLVGEPGVGKRAAVEGLAQRIADGSVPSRLAEMRLLHLELSPVVASLKASGRPEERVQRVLKELEETPNAFFFIEGLFTPAGAENSLDTANILKPLLSRGDIQCIAAATPDEYRKALEKEPWLEESFHSVALQPPSEVEAIQILFAIKGRYEKFHGVAYTDDALKHAVYHSERYMPGRYLPDKAIDLIDEAGAGAALAMAPLPEEVAEVQKRIKFVVHRMQNAIANHEFEKAQFYSQEETKERENLRLLSKKYNQDEARTRTVGLEDIEAVVARRTGVPITTIRRERTLDSGNHEAGSHG